MKIVASLPETDLLGDAISFGPDLIELRIDLMEEDPKGSVERAREETAIPLIGTLRSIRDGGKFSGADESWQRTINELLPFFDYIDVEARYRRYAPLIKSAGTGIIASLHTTDMPSIGELRRIHQVLSEYGDIPKIAVQPRTEQEVITLLFFTEEAKKPVVTSIMGDRFRHFRPLLPLFGSEFMFCHVGRPTAGGQYHIREIRTLYRILLGPDKGDTAPEEDHTPD
jgi:3-dehydroquinate dehydratase-1